ncbi:SGNH/GDSL hydrolase family protein [Angustibacter aerolatus]
MSTLPRVAAARRLDRADRGVGTLEFTGIVTVVAAIIVLLTTSSTPQLLAGRVSQAVCTITGGEHCEAAGAGGGGQALTPYEQAVSGGYVALGDSFSSGEGAGDYAPDSDRDENSTWDHVGQFLDDHLIPGDHTTKKPENYCHRSGNAYGQIVAGSNDFAGGSSFAACSGAVTTDFRNPNGGNADERAQLDQITKDTSFITFSVGGNDVGFADVLRDCVWDGATCQGKHDAKFAQDLVDLKPKLVQLYRDALSRAAPGARLVVVGYPQLFPDDPSDSYRNLLYADSQVWMNAKGAELNAMLASAAREAGVEFVDPTEAFAGHGIGSDDPWFNDIELGGPGFSPVDPGSFHPNAAGQAALAALVQEQLRHPRR